MSVNMTIAQGLKQKNKLVTKIQKNWERIQKFNSYVADSVNPFDVEKILEENLKMTEELVEIKTKIHKASEPVRHIIFRLSEIKNIFSSLSCIPIKEGKVKERYDQQYVEMKAVLTAKKIDEMIEKFEIEKEKLQDELDSFNHKTFIG
jgi:DNA repair ATPase RecN